MTMATAAVPVTMAVANPKRVRMATAKLTTADLAKLIRTQGWATVGVAAK